MKSKYRNILVYLLLVILPSTIITLIAYHTAVQGELQNRKENTSWIATIHQRSWDQLLSETMTTLEILSYTLKADMSIEQIEQLLQNTHRMDPRYGGVYLLNPDGKIQAGSNHFLDNSADDNKAQQFSESQGALISPAMKTLENGQKVIAINKPIFNRNGQIESILVAHLRIDYLKNIMKLLTPDSNLAVVNLNGQPLLEINMDTKEATSANSITHSLDIMSWNIIVELPSKNVELIWKQAGKNALNAFIITNILFFLINYYMLKRQNLEAKKENELQKLELVGTLAASTAHEIRNPLTGIKGLVHLLSEKHTDAEDQYYFSVINEEINRINEIVSEFLILGKPTAQKNEIIDLQDIIKTINPLIYSEANLFQVTYETFLPEEAIFVQCSKDQMKQVILNITKNAFESMETGGNLQIRLIPLGKECNISISDTGKGIPNEQLEKIFQPFFTSKDTGTGLGLVVCRRIIQSFGGKICITSKIGKGTKVDILLPTVHL